MALAVVLLVDSGNSGDAGATEAAGPRARSAAPPQKPPRRPALPPGFSVLQLREGAQVLLRRSPGGRVVRPLSARSEFGSPRVLAVVRRRGSWIGVITPLLRNGEVGWVRYDPAQLYLYRTPYALRISLSQRKMTLRRAGRSVTTYTVSVGAAGTETPKGRFAITDALIYDDSPYYGCCALALSGHQEKLPVGWLGGDRIAIHGTPGEVGFAASSGCIRATDRTMRSLLRRIPLGTPVFVVA